MNDSQEALRKRFRAALAERTRSIAVVTAESKNPPDARTRQELLGLLHTLKGEARMLGLSRLATISHSLEEQLVADDLDFEAFAAIVDAVSLAMAEATSDGESKELLQTAVEALGLDKRIEADSPESHRGEGQQTPSRNDRWIQVDANVVERLGESLASITVTLSQHAASLGSQNEAKRRDALLELEELRARLQDALSMALDLRLTSIEPLLSSMAANIRLLSKERGKPAQVVVRAGGVRVERDVLEALREPLLHMCSNAVVHGLERPEEREGKAPQGRIELRAESSGAGVVVRVSDDGRGIDLERLGRTDKGSGAGDVYDFLFEPGFSTHEGTDEVAGRGVGLDVVKRQVLGMGGNIEVESEKGKGSTFTVNVPALLTQQTVIAFEVGRTLYGVAAHHVSAILAREDGEEKSVKFQGETVPIRSLSAIVGQVSERAEQHLLLLRVRQQTWALAVGRLIGHFEVIRRPCSAAMRARTGVGASAQLEDGRLLLLLSSGFIEQRFHSNLVPEVQSPVEAKKARKFRPRVLVVDDSVVVRDLISEVLTSAGYEVGTAEDGVRALQELDRFSPGLVVSDIEMPNMDGFDLLAAIRERSQTLPVVLVTARSSAKDRQRASSLGASAYIAKGEFHRDSLLATIDRYYPQIT